MSTRTSAAAPARAMGDRVEAALALQAGGRIQEALDLLFEPTSFSQDVYTLRGDLQVQLGQLHDALGSYSTVVAFERDNMYAHHRLGICLCLLERWDLAAETFRKLLAHDTHSDRAHIGLGDCLLHLHRPEEALAAFEACWSEAARVPALFGKAVALQLLHRFDQAEILYQRVLELEPRPEEALGNLIAMSVEVFDLARIHRYASRLACLSPQSPVALQALTLVAFERRDYQAAAGYFAGLGEQAFAGSLSGSDEAENEIKYRLSWNDIARLSSFRRTPPPAASTNPSREGSREASPLAGSSEG
jgi:tetratricopeptide (TPR) repeat protein